MSNNKKWDNEVCASFRLLIKCGSCLLIPLRQCKPLCAQVIANKTLQFPNWTHLWIPFQKTVELWQCLLVFCLQNIESFQFNSIRFVDDWLLYHMIRCAIVHRFDTYFNFIKFTCNFQQQRPNNLIAISGTHFQSNTIYTYMRLHSVQWEKNAAVIAIYFAAIYHDKQDIKTIFEACSFLP